MLCRHSVDGRDEGRFDPNVFISQQTSSRSIRGRRGEIGARADPRGFPVAARMSRPHPEAGHAATRITDTPSGMDAGESAARRRPSPSCRDAPHARHPRPDRVDDEHLVRLPMRPPFATRGDSAPCRGHGIPGPGRPPASRRVALGPSPPPRRFVAGRAGGHRGLASAAKTNASMRNNPVTPPSPHAGPGAPRRGSPGIRRAAGPSTRIREGSP
jgi:hypothetical protein